MHPRSLTLAISAAALAVAVSAAPLAAQSQRRGPTKVPPGHLPPAGTCRVWYEGVPPGRQPAPTSCADAERRASGNARVIYGAGTDARGGVWDGRRDDGRYEDRRDDERYDPRYDPRGDSRYDPRYDPRDGRQRTAETDARRRTGTSVYDRVGGYDDRYDCRTTDRYGRCIGDTRALPVMLSVRALQQRRWTSEVERWVGVRPAQARYTDVDRDGRADEIWFLDARGRVLQHWRDQSRDGRADRVGLYQSGRLQRTVG